MKRYLVKVLKNLKKFKNLKLFIKKVRLSLLNVWEENVVKKIENINLINPAILKNNV